MSLAWFKIYPSDYLSDAKVRMLPRDHRSVLLDLWCHCAKDGSIPSDPALLARILGESAGKTKRFLENLSDFFEKSEDIPGRLFSKRIKEETEKYESKCEHLRANAAKGGLGKVANARANATEDPLANALAEPAELESESDKRVQDALSAPGAPPPVRARKPKSPKPIKLVEETNPSKILGGLPHEWVDVFWRLKNAWDKFCSQPRNLTQCARQWVKLHEEGQVLEEIRAGATRYFDQVKSAMEKRPDAIPRDLLVFLNSYS